MTEYPEEWNGGYLYPGKISSDLPGYRLGDGVFETVRTYNRKPFRLGDHIERLLAGAHNIGFPDLPNHEIIEAEIGKTVNENTDKKQETEWVIRPTFFSDRSSWGFFIPTESWQPRNAQFNADGVNIGISPYRHPGKYLVPPGANEQVKWLARGPLSHALRDAGNRGWGEALLLNSRSEVVEGTRSNIFLIDGNSIISPGVQSGAFPGITRKVVIECALKLDLIVIDRPITLKELKNAQEVLLTSTLLGVIQAASITIDGRSYGKSSGHASSLLITEFEKLVAEECLL